MESLRTIAIIASDSTNLGDGFHSHHLNDAVYLVEVDVEQRVLLLALVRRADRLLDPRIECHPVEQTRQSVVVRLVGQLQRQRAQLGHIVEYHD